MYNTYYLSPLGFEFLLSLTVSRDVLVPTDGVLKLAEKGEIYTEIGAMAKNGLLGLDEAEQKIVVEPGLLNAFRQIAASKKVAVLNSHLRPGGAMCLYHSDCYVAAEMTATRPGKVKLSLFEDDLIGEYFSDVSWLSNGDAQLLEDSAQNDGTEEGESVLLSADFYVSSQKIPREKLIVVNEEGQKKLLLRCGGGSCSSQDYGIEKLIEKLGDFFCRESEGGEQP